MTKVAIERGLFEGIEVRHDKIPFSHLQYADDTIFIGEWGLENIDSLQNLCGCFELASGLKVNYHKSFMYGIGVNSSDLDVVASRVGCQVGQFPFTYLSLPIGSKMKKLKDWSVVIEKFKSKLSGWRIRSMSYGGRLGEADSGSKIHWVKWDNVITSYGNGGLNIGPLKSKNLALLGKWGWRKTIGNGESTYFLHNLWIGGSKLKERFSRLYCLEAEKNCLTKDRISGNNMSGTAA
ncbi:uncharacterized protein [Rutidosis leptorrhynchoides]|uniref:uncharacterized protein n=1 Tax=Rutidosis leptorrhynchoides TaxID=125765 RepID=UPI003A9A51F2